MTTDIQAYHRGTNASLIEKVAQLGYIKSTDLTLDLTYGRGAWWKTWRPDRGQLITNDMSLATDAQWHVDFRSRPKEWMGLFDVVAYDPPYLLTGSRGTMPDHYEIESRYGLERGYEHADDSKTLIWQGFLAAVDYLRPGGTLLYKTQDQVSSGKVHWLTMEAWMWGCGANLTLVDRFDMAPARPQPPGRRQVHARRGSTLLIFRKGK